MTGCPVDERFVAPLVESVRHPQPADLRRGSRSAAVAVTTSDRRVSPGRCLPDGRPGHEPDLTRRRRSRCSPIDTQDHTARLLRCGAVTTSPRPFGGGRAAVPVSVAARDPSRGAEAAELLGARFVTLDVTDEESVAAAADLVVQHGLDVLVNVSSAVFH